MTDPVEPSVTVVAVDERGPDERPDDRPVDLDRWRALAEAVLVGEHVAGPAELTLTFVGEAAIAELNAAHLHEEGPTDVLSFPLDAEPDPDDRPGALRLLGDVVVCPAVAGRNAVPPGGYEGELALLVVHGVLHVLGMDHAHAEDAAAMVARERHHLAGVGLERRP